MPRHTYWVDTLMAGTQVAAGAQSIQRLGTADPNFLEERMATVIRTVWNLEFTSTTVAGAWGTQRIGYGVGVESLEAFNGGSHPDPEDAADFPTRGWILRGECWISQNGVGGEIVTRCHGDFRNARKIDNGVLFLIISNTDGPGTAFTAQVAGAIRCLIKGG